MPTRLLSTSWPAFAALCCSVIGVIAIPATSGIEWLRDSGALTLLGGGLGVGFAVFAILRAWSRPAGEATRASNTTVRVGLTFIAMLALAVGGFLITYVLVLTSSMPPDDVVAAVDSELPRIELRDQDGNPFTPAPKDGRRLALVFYRGHW